jgi:hypothetical protein
MTACRQRGERGEGSGMALLMAKSPVWTAFKKQSNSARDEINDQSEIA